MYHLLKDMHTFNQTAQIYYYLRSKICAIHFYYIHLFNIFFSFLKLLGDNYGQELWKLLEKSHGRSKTVEERNHVRTIYIYTYIHICMYVCTVCMYVLLCFISQQASVQKWLVLVKKLSDEASVIYRDSMVLNILVSTYIHTLYMHTYMHAYIYTTLPGGASPSDSQLEVGRSQ